MAKKKVAKKDRFVSWTVSENGCSLCNEVGGEFDVVFSKLLNNEVDKILSRKGDCHVRLDIAKGGKVQVMTITSLT